MAADLYDFEFDSKRNWSLYPLGNGWCGLIDGLRVSNRMLYTMRGTDTLKCGINGHLYTIRKVGNIQKTCLKC